MECIINIRLIRGLKCIFFLCFYVFMFFVFMYFVFMYFSSIKFYLIILQQYISFIVLFIFKLFLSQYINNISNNCLSGAYVHLYLSKTLQSFIFILLLLQ